MSGHSKWETIKRQKGANDAKRGAVLRSWAIRLHWQRAAVDPTLNSALALAIEKAKAANMPGANIQRAIDRVADKNAAVMEEIAYEGYGSSGVGIIIETATDNRNRTLPEVQNGVGEKWRTNRRRGQRGISVYTEGRHHGGWYG